MQAPRSGLSLARSGETGQGGGAQRGDSEGEALALMTPAAVTRALLERQRKAMRQWKRSRSSVRDGRSRSKWDARAVRAPRRQVARATAPQRRVTPAEKGPLRARSSAELRQGAPGPSNHTGDHSGASGPEGSDDDDEFTSDRAAAIAARLDLQLAQSRADAAAIAAALAKKRQVELSLRSRAMSRWIPAADVLNAQSDAALERLARSPPHEVLSAVAGPAAPPRPSPLPAASVARLSSARYRAAHADDTGATAGGDGRVAFAVQERLHPADTDEARSPVVGPQSRRATLRDSVTRRQREAQPRRIRLSHRGTRNRRVSSSGRAQADSRRSSRRRRVPAHQRERERPASGDRAVQARPRYFPGVRVDARGAVVFPSRTTSPDLRANVRPLSAGAGVRRKGYEWELAEYGSDVGGQQCPYPVGSLDRALATSAFTHRSDAAVDGGDAVEISLRRTGARPTQSPPNAMWSSARPDWTRPGTAPVGGRERRSRVGGRAAAAAADHWQAGHDAEALRPITSSAEGHSRSLQRTYGARAYGIASDTLDAHHNNTVDPPERHDAATSDAIPDRVQASADAVDVAPVPSPAAPSSEGATVRHEPSTAVAVADQAKRKVRGMRRMRPSAAAASRDRRARAPRASSSPLRGVGEDAVSGWAGSYELEGSPASASIVFGIEGDSLAMQ